MASEPNHVAAAADLAATADEAKWGKPQFASHSWVEPIIVVSIMIASLYLTRRKNVQIRRQREMRPSILDDADSSDEDLLRGDSDSGNDFEQRDYTGTMPQPKKRSCCGISVRTPNSSRFSNHLHSRILQKLPYLIEMFYWAMNYLFYVLTKLVAEKALGTRDGVWDVAQKHGISILHFEHDSLARIFFPIHEVAFQQWFTTGHSSTLTFLNRAYSIVHIPGTVACIGWYYYSAPSHAKFTVFRRTMTLLNFMSFAIFTAYPCMPPRLLPESYGFFDTVRHDNAESVWTRGNYVNQLAAMPSLHFGYSLCIGSTFIYHSGAFRRLGKGETPMSKAWKSLYVLAGVAYPSFLLTVIVATANHYYLDAAVAAIVLLAAFLCNRVWLNLLPLEDLLLWALRLEKPKPTTGIKNRRLGGV